MFSQLSGMNSVILSALNLSTARGVEINEFAKSQNASESKKLLVESTNLLHFFPSSTKNVVNKKFWQI